MSTTIMVGNGSSNSDSGQHSEQEEVPAAQVLRSIRASCDISNESSFEKSSYTGPILPSIDKREDKWIQQSPIPICTLNNYMKAVCCLEIEVSSIAARFKGEEDFSRYISQLKKLLHHVKAKLVPLLSAGHGGDSVVKQQSYVILRRVMEQSIIPTLKKSSTQTWAHLVSDSSNPHHRLRLIKMVLVSCKRAVQQPLVKGRQQEQDSSPTGVGDRLNVTQC